MNLFICVQLEAFSQTSELNKSVLLNNLHTCVIITKNKLNTCTFQVYEDTSS